MIMSRWAKYLQSYVTMLRYFQSKLREELTWVLVSWMMCLQSYVTSLCWMMCLQLEFTYLQTRAVVFLKFKSCNTWTHIWTIRIVTILFTRRCSFRALINIWNENASHLIKDLSNVYIKFIQTLDRQTKSLCTSTGTLAHAVPIETMTFKTSLCIFAHLLTLVSRGGVALIDV